MFWLILDCPGHQFLPHMFGSARGWGSMVPDIRLEAAKGGGECWGTEWGAGELSCVDSWGRRARPWGEEVWVKGLKKSCWEKSGEGHREDRAPEQNRTDLSVSQSAFMNDWSVHLREWLEHPPSWMTGASTFMNDLKELVSLSVHLHEWSKSRAKLVHRDQKGDCHFQCSLSDTDSEGCTETEGRSFKTGLQKPTKDIKTMHAQCTKGEPRQRESWTIRTEKTRELMKTEKSWRRTR